MQKSAPFLPRHIINLLLGYTVISQNVSGVPNSWPLNPIVNPRFLVSSHLRNHSCRGAVSISLRLHISVFRAPSRRWEWTKGPRAWSQVVVIFFSDGFWGVGTLLVFGGMLRVPTSAHGVWCTIVAFHTPPVHPAVLLHSREVPADK